ncbi:hypothetical protein Tco_0293521, partial [Tanacetum coccineum]
EKDNASNVVVNDPAKVDKEKDKSPVKDKEKAQVSTVKDTQVVGKVQVLNKASTLVVIVPVEMDKGNDKENDNVPVNDKHKLPNWDCGAVANWDYGFVANWNLITLELLQIGIAGLLPNLGYSLIC